MQEWYSCSLGKKPIVAVAMKSGTSIRNAQEKIQHFTYQNCKKRLCDTSQWDCCLPVLLYIHPLERRCVCHLCMSSGNIVLHNKCLSLERAISPLFAHLAAKSGNSLWKASTITKFIPTVPVNGIVELENEKPSASVYQLSIDLM